MPPSALDADSQGGASAREMSLRHWFLHHRLLGLAASTLLAASVVPASATSPLLANGDYPYWKLNYARYDTTYGALDRQARRFPEFKWDSTTYCRYRSGWEGPGAYKVGDRYRRRFGWDAGYSWQGPGVAADHEDEGALAEARADYRHDFGREPVCGAVRHHRRVRREVVLRRKD